MLSNITVNGRSPLQTILLGQPQFRRMLASPDLEQLRQRVLASYHLGPLSEPETRAYIEHRLKMVGWTGNPDWEDAAYFAVYRHTGGIPRRVNTLCSRVLLYCALEEVCCVTKQAVDHTAGELQHDLMGSPAQVSRPQVHEVDSTVSNLAGRVQRLEHSAARQERIFRRLLELLSAHLEPPT